MELTDNTHAVNAVQGASNWPIAIRNGAIWAAVGFGITLIGFLTNSDPSLPGTSMMVKTISGLLSFGFTIWLIRWAILQDRTQLGGYITHGRCIGLSAKLGLIAGTLGGIGQAIYTQLINTEYQELMNEGTRQAMEAKGMDDAQIEQAIEMSAIFTGPVPLIIIFMIITVIIGVIVGAVAGFFLKRDRYPAA